MRAQRKIALALGMLVAACTRPAPTPSADASAATLFDAAAAPLACAIPVDAEMMHDRSIADACLEDFFGACRSDCVHTCSTCGQGCTTEQCRADCLSTRDRCARGHEGKCANAYRDCRTKLVTDWLADGCDVVCAPFRRCPECDAGAKSKSCVPARCDAMQSAPERKVLDPKWKANQCDAVCAKIWSCAEKECESSSCAEPIKKYKSCATRTPGAAACGQDGPMPLLCTEPRH